jgi:hypothetical protein
MSPIRSGIFLAMLTPHCFAQHDQTLAALSTLRNQPNNELAMSSLESLALEAINYPGPTYEVYENGKLAVSGISAAFRSWCERTGLDPIAERRRITSEFPARILALQAIPRARSRPLFQRAIRSPLSAVSVPAAVALGEGGDAQDLRTLLGEWTSRRASSQDQAFETGFLLGIARIEVSEKDPLLRRFLTERNLTSQFRQLREQIRREKRIR